MVCNEFGCDTLESRPESQKFHGKTKLKIERPEDMRPTREPSLPGGSTPRIYSHRVGAVPKIPTGKHMDLLELLAFVDECDLSDDEDNQQVQKRSSPGEHAQRISKPMNNSEGGKPKSRPRRDTVEIAALRRRLAILTLELERVNQKRSASTSGSKLLLTQTSLWYPEAARQSRLRAASQNENERLRAKIQAQLKIATRFVNICKRSPTNQVLHCY